MRSFSYSSKAHTHDVRTFCTKCSWVKLRRRCSTLPKWPLNIFWGFPWWYEHPALMPRWQHHLSSMYQPAFNSAPNMCGTDWEQLVLSSLFPWQLKILLYSKILSCYFYPPSFYFFFFCVCVNLVYISFEKSNGVNKLGFSLCIHLLLIISFSSNSWEKHEGYICSSTEVENFPSHCSSK